MASRPYDERPLGSITSRERDSIMRSVCAKLGLNYNDACGVEVIGAIHKLQVSLYCLETGLRTPPAVARGPRRAGW